MESSIVDVPNSLTTRGVYDFFRKFLSQGLLNQIIGVIFFSIFLIVPLLGGSSKTTVGELLSASIFLSLTTVFVLMILAIHIFSRKSSDLRLKAIAAKIQLVIAIPILLYLIAIIMEFLLGSEISTVLRATSSVVILVPLLLIIMMLVESVIRHGIVEKGSKVPIVLVLLTIFLVMYTFATIYYVNGLLVQSGWNGGTGTVTGAVDFSGSLYYSGLIFTTLGASEISPVGIGQGVTLFESVTGYIVLSFLTAVFIQAIISAREKAAPKD